MKRRTLIYVATAINVAIAGAACSSARGDEKKATDGAKRSGDAVTVEGCLSTDSQGRFAITAAPDAAASTMAARSMEIERDTHAYVLIGGTDLQSHLGKRVAITGTVEGKKIEYENTEKKKTEQQPATGGDHNEPVVKTRETVDLEARRDIGVVTLRDKQAERLSVFRPDFPRHLAP